MKENIQIEEEAMVSVEGEGEFESPLNALLMEVLEENGAQIMFGCKTAACGTCRIRVLNSPQNLSDMEEEERDFLSYLGAGPQERLACQVKVRGSVSIESV